MVNTVDLLTSAVKHLTTADLIYNMLAQIKHPDIHGEEKINSYR
jgi:hypothetical protein